MSTCNSVPYSNYLGETKLVVNKCYPLETSGNLIGVTTLLFELNEHPEQYPMYATANSDRHRCIILSHNLKDDLKWEQRSKSRGKYHNRAVYLRVVDECQV